MIPMFDSLYLILIARNVRFQFIYTFDSISILWWKEIWPSTNYFQEILVLFRYIHLRSSRPTYLFIASPCSCCYLCCLEDVLVLAQGWLPGIYYIFFFFQTSNTTLTYNYKHTSNCVWLLITKWILFSSVVIDQDSRTSAAWWEQLWGETTHVESVSTMVSCLSFTCYRFLYGCNVPHFSLTWTIIHLDGT